MKNRKICEQIRSCRISEKMITLSDITVSYGKNTVYQNFSHTFDKGVNVVLGKSGCGKTTLLNVIAHLVPFAGECDAGGKSAVVFQQPSLAPVSVKNNVDLVLPRGDNSEKISHYLQLAQIDDKQSQNALTLSGGEQQRVSLARAFAAETPVLLLDEPFSGLDYGVKAQLRLTLNTLLADSDKTVVLVTHDIDDALSLADRIYFLRGRPCEISLVAELSVSRSKRSEFDEQTTVLKKQLQELFFESEK